MKKTKISSRIASKGGSYSLAATAIVLAILVAINVLAGALPSSMMKQDISATRLYSITSSTKAVVNALDQDVTIYWVVQADQEDSVIENLLSKYESLSSHISVVKKNPDVYPTFTAQYTDEDVPNNSLIVECGDKSRYISYDNIYLQDVDYNTYSYTYSFDGEGCLTSAINYVISDQLPKVYTLEGHGEADLPDEFSNQIEKENIDIETLSLVSTDAVPEDADCLMIFSPTSDISQEEATILKDYLENGGKLLAMAGPTENGSLTNLYSVLEAYGVSAAEGLVIEGDSTKYAFGYPYILLPEIASGDITDPLIEDNYYVIFPLAQGLTIDSSSSATALLETSTEAYSKTAGYTLTTYDKEEGDIDGAFALAVTASTGNEGQLIWFSSGTFLDETYNSYSSGANLNLAMNAISSLIGERDAVSIRSKSLNYNYLTISDSNASFLKFWMIGLVPLIFVIYGIITVVERRRKRHA